MKDVAKQAETIADNIEKISVFFKRNWKSVVVVLWMLLVTLTLIKQQQAIEKSSSFTQVGNINMAVGDIRYSLESITANIEQMQRSVTRLDHTVEIMDSTVNRIQAQVRNRPEPE